MDLRKLIDGLKLKPRGGAAPVARLGKADLGVLKVAFMVAALDGEVTDDEYAVFDLLARRCRGYTEEAAESAIREAMRSAGYLLLLSRRVKEEELVGAFVAEAKAALPGGFAYLSIEEVRRAVVIWIAMALGDGDYSARERACIEALRRNFAELKVLRVQAEEESWMALAPAFARAYSGAASSRDGKLVELVSRDFVGRVECLVAQYGDSEAAAKELWSLVEGRG